MSTATREFLYEGTCSCPSWPRGLASDVDPRRVERLHQTQNTDAAWRFIAKTMADSYSLDLCGQVGDQWCHHQSVVQGIGERDVEALATIRGEIECGDETRTYDVDVSLHIEIETCAGEARRV